MNTQNPQQFNVGVKAFLQKDGKLLVIKEARGREAYGEQWELPGGRINVGEEKTPLTKILKREVAEELGDIEFTVDRAFHTWVRHFEIKKNYAFLVGFLCHYISGEISLSDEHTEFAWVNEAESAKINFLPEYVEPVKKYWESLKK